MSVCDYLMVLCRYIFLPSRQRTQDLEASIAGSIACRLGTPHPLGPVSCGCMGGCDADCDYYCCFHIFVLLLLLSLS